MLSLSRRLVAGRGRSGHAWPVPLFVALMVISGFGGALLLPAGGALAAPVTGEDSTVFAGPGGEYDQLSSAPAGSDVGVEGAVVDGFVPVSVDGVSGWVEEGALNEEAVYAEPVYEEAVYDEIGYDEPVYEEAVYEEPAYEEMTYEETYIEESAAVESAAPSGGGDIAQIISDAAARYGQDPQAMLRVATCESNLDPNAINGPGDTHGLFQFLPGTFAGTPYAGSSIYDPYANANAAAWMWSEGRRGEWVCQ